METEKNNTKMKQVVVFSPSRYSLYTICVAELLKRNNIHIKAIVIRRLFNPGRFLFEIKRDGTRLIKKIWKKLFLRKKAYHQSHYETIVDLMKNENIHFSKVDDFHKYYGIPIIYCNNLNDTIVINTLQKLKPDIVVFTGGGLIRNDILMNSGAGVLNCHMGVLPQYRGMDVVEWPILENNFDQIGMTAHFMDNGVDTGDILHVKKIEIDPCKNIKQLRDKFEPIMCRLMVQVCIDYLNGKLKRVKQQLNAGKQYFIMHPRLVEIAESKLMQKSQ